MPNVITPLGGKHRSARSLLAEIMNDDISKCVVVCIDAAGDSHIAHFDMTLAEMCYAAEMIRRFSFGEL